MTGPSFAEMTEAERLGMLRVAIATASENLQREVWKLLGLPDPPLPDNVLTFPRGADARRRPRR